MLIWSRHGFATKTPVIPQSQLIFVLTLLALLCPLGRVSGQAGSDKFLPAQVLQDLLDRHGENSTISVPQLRSLLAVLSQPQGEGEGEKGGRVPETPTTMPPTLNSSKVRAQPMDG